MSFQKSIHDCAVAAGLYVKAISAPRLWRDPA